MLENIHTKKICSHEKKRQWKGTNIPLPCEPPVKKLRHKLANKSRSGVVPIGHQINPKLFSELSVEGYLHYKTITSQNLPSEAQVKNFFVS